MTLTLPAGPHARDEGLRPPAIAKVWVGASLPHETVAVPGVTLDEGDVLIAVELATVCGSDLHTVAGRRDAPTPLVLGHEFVGRIVAIGEGGARDVDAAPLNIGDRVVSSLCTSCGTCDRCRRGLPQKCRDLRKYGHERIEPRWELTGGFATHVHLRSRSAIVRVGEQPPAAVVAPASCATATAWAALGRAELVFPLRGRVLLVTGAGLVGLSAAAMAADRGATVIVADPSKERRRLARRFGASATVDPSSTSGSSSLSAAKTSIGRDEIDVLVEASGSVRAVSMGLGALAIGGVAVLIGSVTPGAKVTIDPERIVRSLITIAGVHNYTPADLRDAVGFLRDRGVVWPFASAVSETLPLDRLDEAFACAMSGDLLRVGVDPRM